VAQAIFTVVSLLERIYACSMFLYLRLVLEWNHFGMMTSALAYDPRNLLNRAEQEEDVWLTYTGMDRSEVKDMYASIN
jgi:hypothetical protein